VERSVNRERAMAVMGAGGRHGATGGHSAPWLALGAVAGPVMFALAWVVLGLLRSGYSAISQPISALAIGPNGTPMDAAFLADGILTMVGVVAALLVFRRSMSTRSFSIIAALLLISPLGILWDGIFTMNDLVLHTIGAQVAIGIPIIAFPVAGMMIRRTSSLRQFRRLLLIAAPLILVLLIGFMTSVPFTQMATGGGYYGLWERALAIVVQACYVVLGCVAFRSPSSSPMEDHGTMEVSIPHA
jgi:hypothetical protein